MGLCKVLYSGGLLSYLEVLDKAINACQQETLKLFTLKSKFYKKKTVFYHLTQLSTTLWTVLIKDYRGQHLKGKLNDIPKKKWTKYQ